MKTIPFSLLMTATAVQSDHIETTQNIYNCFLQGDIPGILSKLSDDIVWAHFANPAVVPFGGTRYGHEGVVDFFQSIGQNIQITVFEPSDFRMEGNVVSNDLYYEATVNATGKKYSVHEVFNWTFGPDGKVVRWDPTGETGVLEEAFRQ